MDYNAQSGTLALKHIPSRLIEITSKICPSSLNIALKRIGRNLVAVRFLIGFETASNQNNAETESESNHYFEIAMCNERFCGALIELDWVMEETCDRRYWHVISEQSSFGGQVECLI